MTSDVIVVNKNIELALSSFTKQQDNLCSYSSNIQWYFTINSVIFIDSVGGSNTYLTLYKAIPATVHGVAHQSFEWRYLDFSNEFVQIKPLSFGDIPHNNNNRRRKLKYVKMIVLALVILSTGIFIFTKIGMRIRNNQSTSILKLVGTRHSLA